MCIGYMPWHSVSQVHVVSSVEGSAPIRTLVSSVEVEKVFKNIDMDGSGVISAQELKAALNGAHVDIKMREVDEALSIMGTNQDGQIGLNEFRAAFAAARLSGGVDVYLPIYWSGTNNTKTRGDKMKLVKYYESAVFKERLCMTKY